MWFRNLLVYRLTQDIDLATETLETRALPSRARTIHPGPEHR